MATSKYKNDRMKKLVTALKEINEEEKRHREVEVSSSSSPSDESMVDIYKDVPDKWQIVGGTYFTYTKPVVANKVKPNYYSIINDQRLGIGLRIRPMMSDELFELPFPESEEILKDVKNFWSQGEKFKEYGFCHKRGILIYGPPGNGKTSIIQLLVNSLIKEQEGIIISISNVHELEYFTAFVPKIFRSIEPGTPIIAIFEDIDGMLDDGYAKGVLLNLLDGINQTDKVVYVATTNYPERLEENIVNRPSRFDRRYEIGLPNDNVRRAYLENKLTTADLDYIDLEQWVYDTQDLSVSHLKELVISVIVLGNDYNETLETLKGMKKQIKMNNKAKPMGFK